MEEIVGLEHTTMVVSTNLLSTVLLQTDLPGCLYREFMNTLLHLRQQRLTIQDFGRRRLAIGVLPDRKLS